jgi:hypothetical protein
MKTSEKLLGWFLTIMFGAGLALCGITLVLSSALVSIVKASKAAQDQKTSEAIR